MVLSSGAAGGRLMTGILGDEAARGVVAGLSGGDGDGDGDGDG